MICKKSPNESIPLVYELFYYFIVPFMDCVHFMILPYADKNAN